MRIATVHYHLGDGGVARVMRLGFRAMAEAGVAQVILAGDPVVEGGGVFVRQVDGLGYGGGGARNGRELAARLREAARQALGGGPDLWHIHNHALGKNPALTAAVAELAAAGERLVLQLHDLAEDGRPELYRALAGLDQRYPCGPRIRYVFLNGRDRSAFLQAGLREEWAVLLPNPVDAPPPQAEVTAGAFTGPLLFAPIRGIRRKNLGELVLWSVLGPRDARLAVSQAPRDGGARRGHDLWQAFARVCAPRIEFAVSGRLAPAPGAPCTFESWIAHCTHVVGTSVAEGFGLSFAEASAWGKPFVGRNLPWLGHDLDATGLYDRLLVPAEWIGRSMLRGWLATNLERNHRAWGKPIRKTEVEAALDQLWGDGWLDFGNLPEALQQGVIERCTEPIARQEVMVETGGRQQPAGPWWQNALSTRPARSAGTAPGLPPDIYQKRLTSIYQELLAAPERDAGRLYLDPRRVLDPHTRPESFHFLLSAPAPAGHRPARFRAVICDVYGTLLDAPPGGVRPDDRADPLLRQIIRRFGHEPPHSPSRALHEAVERHHRQSDADFPEVDLRRLWREVLGLEPDADTTALVIATEDAWHPARLMAGAADALRRLVASGVPVGLLSNAQCNTLPCLGGLAELLEERLVVLSYRHGVAKPSARLFGLLVQRLESMGIPPAEVLFIGNDPLHDIAPAAASGFVTALFTGHPGSLRPGDAVADFTLRSWHDLARITSAKMRTE